MNFYARRAWNAIKIAHASKFPVPELPELEIAREVLQKRVVGKKIARVELLQPTAAIVVRDLTTRGFIETLTEAAIENATRRGKFLVFDFDMPPKLVINPKLTGRLQLAPPQNKRYKKLLSSSRSMLKPNCVITTIERWGKYISQTRHSLFPISPTWGLNRSKCRSKIFVEEQMKLMLRVQLVIAQEPKKILPNIKVALYDRDWRSDNDLLGTNITDAKGEIFFQFDEKKYKDQEDSPDWRIESLPDLDVNVYDAQGNVVYSTREVVERDKFPKLLVVPVPRAVVEQHKLVS